MQDYYSNTYIYTFDGRTNQNSGNTYGDFYNIIKERMKYIRLAYVLDGGGSTLIRNRWTSKERFERIQQRNKWKKSS
jgi:exopolysaccharide biosynthesis protein